MPDATADAIVLGVGGVGAAVTCALSRRGLSVIALEQFDVPHDRGSSHGHTRIVRRAYFEHPDYIPLLNRSYELWDDLEQASGAKLLYKCGLLLGGAPDSGLIQGIRASAAEHNLALDELDEGTVRSAYPGFRPDGDMDVLFERDGGFVLLEDSMRAHVRLARASGADVRTSAVVRGWDSGADRIQVQTDAGTYEGARLVVCAGPWASRLVGDLGARLVPKRAVALWMAEQPSMYSLEEGAPVFAFDTPNGFFYGIPAIDDRGVKIAEHEAHSVVDNPAHLDTSLRESDLKPPEAFTKRYLPHATFRASSHAACMYTMTDDRHFVIDRHPEFGNVMFVAGLSGHGYKFVPVFGEICAAFCLDEALPYSIEFLSLARFGDRTT